MAFPNQTYLRIRHNRTLNVLAMLTRYLIGFAFIPSGLTKLLGNRFTLLTIDDPIGFFFEGLYRTGMYWHFLGLVQVVAAFLLMSQRFATMGAVMFLGILSNVWLITLSMHFGGTWVITSLMMLANLWLIAWDMEKLLPLFLRDNTTYVIPNRNYPTYNRTWIITGYFLFVYCTVSSLLVLVFNIHSLLFSLVQISVVLLSVGITVWLHYKNEKKARHT